MSVWDEVVGQEHALAVLRQAADGARAIVDHAQEAHPAADTSGSVRADASSVTVPTDDLSRSMTHAWLITGPPGSGRSVAAIAFAAALQCTGEIPGCGQCPGCRTTMARTNGDVSILTTESTQIRIDEVRQIVLRAQTAPSQGRWRVIVIEDADRMMERTANVLLKAIEEPPERTVWLLCAPSAEDMITTIRSRCRHLGLRIPDPHAVADLLVRRDGVDPADALSAARAAQSHIGLARALAKDPKMRQRRRQIITAPAQVRSVGEAVFAAEDLLSIAKTQAESQLEERNAREKAELMRQLGMEEGQSPASHQRARIRELEEDQKRRSKRAIQDSLDRALVDLLGIYRDVLMRQLGTDQEPINDDCLDLIDQLCAQSTPQQTMKRVQAIEEARKRLTTNMSVPLILESMALSLRPQV
mgnify:FL=1